MPNFLNRFKPIRRLRGGRWYKLYFQSHYLHSSYCSWERNISLTQFPFNGRVVGEENHN